MVSLPIQNVMSQLYLLTSIGLTLDGIVYCNGRDTVQPVQTILSVQDILSMQNILWKRSGFILYLIAFSRVLGGGKYYNKIH